MFNNYEQIKRRIDSIQEELKHIEKLKKEFPKENLICAKTINIIMVPENRGRNIVSSQTK